MSRFKPAAGAMPFAPLDSYAPPRTQESSDDRWIVAFVCLGNACRSQIAEGFARTYGSDVMSVHSCGIIPMIQVPPETIRSMAECKIDISAHFPKDLRTYPADYFDLLINMSGEEIRGRPNVRDWPIRDPYGRSEKIFREVRQEIEQKVIALIDELRGCPRPVR